MTVQTEIPPTQIACGPVQQEFGRPPDPDLLHDPAFSGVVTDVAANLEAAHAYLDMGEERGAAAQKVLDDLGCVACELNVTCPVNRTLKEKVATGQANRELRQKAAMFQNAPAWLTIARLNQPSISPEVSKKILAAAGDVHKTDELLESGELDLDQLLGDVTNELAGTYTKATLPELQKVRNADPDAVIGGHTITTQNGDKFTVLDASKAVGFSGTAPSRADYIVMVNKLLGRMSSRDEQGKPQILNADGKMQSPIYQLNGVPVFELRMNGKNRMYLAIDSSQTEEPPRITILGSHGGDAETQRAFLDVALAE